MRRTQRGCCLYYVIPLLAGLAAGFAFIPPSAGSVLVANMLNVDLGVMIAVGVPVGILSLLFAGILWSKFIGGRISTGLPSTIQEVQESEEKNLPAFTTVLCIIFVPLVLILYERGRRCVLGRILISNLYRRKTAGRIDHQRVRGIYAVWKCRCKSLCGKKRCDSGDARFAPGRRTAGKRKICG